MKMSKIVRTGADILYPFVLIFGLYIVLHGHLTPGGGFQGGAVIATGVVLVIVANSYEAITGMLRKVVFKAQESIGLLLRQTRRQSELREPSLNLFLTQLLG